MDTMSTAKIVLAKGSHPSHEDGSCLLEAYNWIVRHTHTDSRPPGVSPVLHQFGMSLNDILPHAKRQELVRFLPNGADRLAGTEDDGRDETRGYMALDWLIRTWTPAWLDLAGLGGEAAALRGFRRIADLAAAQSVRPHVMTARDKAAAAWDAAGAAAGAWAAAGAAAWAAAGAATWAGDAAWDAAGAAAWDAAGAGAAAGAAAGARAAAGAAAGAATREFLAPTVASLQDAAISLYDQMITGEW